MSTDCGHCSLSLIEWEWLQGGSCVHRTWTQESFVTSLFSDNDKMSRLSCILPISDLKSTISQRSPGYFTGKPQRHVLSVSKWGCVFKRSRIIAFLYIYKSAFLSSNKRIWIIISVLFSFFPKLLLQTRSLQTVSKYTLWSFSSNFRSFTPSTSYLLSTH